MSRQIQLNKRRFLISRRTEPIYTTVDFDSSEEAARAYDEAIKKLFGDLAEPNFDDRFGLCDMTHER